MQKTLYVQSAYIRQHLLRDDSEFMPVNDVNDLYLPILLECSCGNRAELFYQELKANKAKACSSCRSRNYYGLATWTQQVKLRDNKVCKYCSSTNKIVAHHIKPKELYPELRLDINNGITLCYSCHLLAHTTFEVKAQNGRDK
jgi:5-methylcytosine-specific restriction endonuclease McrA